MKKIIISLALLVISTIVFCQNPLGRRYNQLNLGVGLTGWGIPLYLGLDRYISRDVSLGGELSYRAYNEKWHDDYYNHNIMGVSGNLNYHLNRILDISSPWDLYLGPNVGFYVWTSPDGYTGNRSSGLGLGGQIGIRYYFTNKVGINLEFGGGNAFTGGKLGLSFPL